MTNREWLESLSDEGFIEQIYVKDFECNTCAYNNTKQCEDGDYCVQGHIEWLRAEHKDD